MGRAGILTAAMLLAAFAVSAGDAAWVISEGARSGDGPASRLAEEEGGALRLEGDAATRVWKLAARAFPASPGKSYRVTFEARASGVRKEPGQFNSCYVGIALLDAAGKVIGLRVADVLAEAWSAGEVTLAAPAGTARGEARVFLSKTGRLEVRGVAISEERPEESFARLVADMDRHYSYFELKKIDWKALTGKYRERAESAKDAAEFVSIVAPMLAELRDGHIWIDAPGAPRVVPFPGSVTANFDFRAVAAKLASVRQIAKHALVGRTKEGYAYLAVGSLMGEDAIFREIEEATLGLLDAPGLLLDLRGNVGGDETRAQRIAAIFADQERVYARSLWRSGPKHTDFREAPERTIEPRSGPTYTKPIVCLIGPRCVSSGEGFVKMIRVLPHARLVGKPTRGASGNPAPVSLPNGVTVWYSRWVDLMPDGTSPEGKGIAPDVEVEHVGAGDPTFERAVEELRRLLMKD